MTQKIIIIDPIEYDSVLIQIKAKEPPHIKGELGIDVSKWQGTVNWDAMVAAGVGFAGIRATMGATGKDEFFTRNWSEARRVGIQRMAYHYFINNLPAAKQIENFLDTIGVDVGELPEVLDVEPASGQVISNKASNTNEIKILLDAVGSALARTTTIYTNLSAWTACTTIPAWSANYPLWLAQYNTRPAPTVPAPWTTAIIWQYSASGSLAGTSPLDLNRYGPWP